MPEDLPAGVESSINLITAALRYNDLTNGDENPPSLSVDLSVCCGINHDKEEE